MEEFLPEDVKAKVVTKAPAKRAPKKAQKLTGEIKAKIPLERSDDVAVWEIVATEDVEAAVTTLVPAAIIVLAVTAPSVAPDEMPIIPGSASGFLKKSWKTAPLPPRRIPVNKTKRDRGSLSCQMMIWVNLSEEDGARAQAKAWDRLIFSAPKQRAAKKLAANITIEMIKKTFKEMLLALFFESV